MRKDHLKEEMSENLDEIHLPAMKNWVFKMLHIFTLSSIMSHLGLRFRQQIVKLDQLRWARQFGQCQNFWKNWLQSILKTSTAKILMAMGWVTKKIILRILTNHYNLPGCYYRMLRPKAKLAPFPKFVAPRPSSILQYGDIAPCTLLGRLLTAK